MIEYDYGDPTQHGVYACRVPIGPQTNLLQDKFLLWYGGRWSHLGSDQYFRDTVVCWIGPLSRKDRLI